MHILNNIIIFITILTLTYSPDAYSQGSNGLFRSSELKSTELSAFKKWAGLRERHTSEEPLHISKKSLELEEAKYCGNIKKFKCMSVMWQSVMQSAQKKTPIEQMKIINQKLNEAPYVTDMINWQQQDYWATIKQFFSKSGDCEDYAIAKFYSLKKLGFNGDQMRIVIVQDNNLNIAHAVLAVYINDKIWILDNQISNIVTDDKVIHYTPLYSINENAWWLHKSL